MNKPTPLVPVFDQEHIQFFVNPAVIAPFEYRYPDADPYDRTTVISQLLKVPAYKPK